MSKTKADVICGKNGFLVTEYLAGDPRSLSVREICQLRELWATGSEKKKREKKGNYPYLRVSADQRSGFSSAGGDDDVDGLSWKKKWYSNFFFVAQGGASPSQGSNDFLTHLLKRVVGKTYAGIEWIQFFHSKMYRENREGAMRDDGLQNLCWNPLLLEQKKKEKAEFQVRYSRSISLEFPDINTRGVFVNFYFM